MQEITRTDREIDLRGEVCPYTFVWSKLALEEMETGQILRVVVDHLPATTNVPRSLQAEGHRVHRVAQLNDTDWEIVVQKGG
ncbi:MAG: sulfurtransferase TusA family protein [Sphingomonadaceae bacterium]